MRIQRTVLISGGATPTEDIYLMRSAAPMLQDQGLEVARYRPQFRFWPGLRVDRRALLQTLAGHSVLVCRSVPLPMVRFLEKHRCSFKRLDYLIDDDIGAAVADIRLPRAYRRRMARVFGVQQRILSLADHVVASSDDLAATMRQQHQQVTCLPPPMLNKPPGLDHWQEAQMAQMGWKVGYHGTRAHLPDIKAIFPAIQRLTTSPDVSVEIMLGKHAPRTWQQVPNIHLPEALPWSDFLCYQKQQKIHIGLAPLRDTAFNRGKSWIKFLDIAAMGGVGVYANRNPYRQIVRHGVNGLLANDDPQSWFENIRWLMENPVQAQDMAAQAALDAGKIGAHDKAARFWANLWNP